YTRVRFSPLVTLEVDDFFGYLNVSFLNPTQGATQMKHLLTFIALALAVVAILAMAPLANAVVEVPTLTDGPGDAAPPPSPRLIVELASPPLAVAYQSEVGAAAADGSLDTSSAFAAAYVAQLQAEQAAFVNSVEQVIPAARVSTFVNE